MTPRAKRAKIALFPVFERRYQRIQARLGSHKMALYGCAFDANGIARLPRHYRIPRRGTLDTPTGYATNGQSKPFLFLRWL